MNSFKNENGRKYRKNILLIEFNDPLNDNPLLCNGGGGGLFGGGGGGSSGGGGGSTTTVQKSDPWAGQMPYLTTGFQQAQERVLNRNPSYFPGSTVVPYSSETNQAMDIVKNRALDGSPVMDSANQQLLNTLNGQYIPSGSTYDPTMGGNIGTQFNYNQPEFDSRFNDVMNAAANKINPMIDSQFASAGRLNSGLGDTAKTEALGNVFANQYFNQYNTDKALQAGLYGQNQQLGAAGFDSAANRDLNASQAERTNQMRSIMFSPQAANQDYTDASQLGQVGAQKENLDQQYLADQISRYNYGQNIGQSQLADYMNLIQGNYGGTSSTNANATGPSTNRLLTGIGGAAAGAGLGSLAGASYAPWGAGAGLLAGLLF